MRFARFGAAVENVDTLGGLFTAIGLGTRETSVTGHDATESALTPAKLGGSLLLHSLHRVEGVLASRWAVAHNLTGSLHHVNT